MKSRTHFSSLVVTALVAWTACAGLFAVADCGADPAPRGASIASAFPTAEAGFAAQRVVLAR